MDMNGLLVFGEEIAIEMLDGTFIEGYFVSSTWVDGGLCFTYTSDKYEAIYTIPLKEMKRAYTPIRVLRIESEWQKVKGYSSLYENEKKLLRTAYRNHLNSMGKEIRKLYTRDKILEVKRDLEEKTVNIYFESIWWHYDQDGTWY